ncbi:unnamed protein product [Clavelina lepadiformis]|uniref:G-protein coupled receptors family 1 profile domain-containing protein n=1 Tax=Clavelina lepadiformis TaxID=159417 RepID=A0ABP0FJ70_CLALP
MFAWDSVLMLVVCILGLVGNIILAFVLLALKEFKKSVTHWYVLQLAVADSLFLLTLPFVISEAVNKEWIYPEWMCKARETILFINYYASVLFLTIMSIDRYIAVCHAFSNRFARCRKRKFAAIVTMVTWTISIILATPIMLYAQKLGNVCTISFPFFEPPNYGDNVLGEGSASASITEPNFDIADFDIRSDFYEQYTFPMIVYDGIDVIPVYCNYRNSPESWWAFIYYNFIAMFIFPFLIMSVCYGLIIHRLFTKSAPTSVRKKSSSSGGKSRSGSMSVSHRDRVRVTKMSASLVVTFFACWVTFHSVHLAKIDGIKSTDPGFCAALTSAASLLAFANSMLDPFLYGIFGNRFSKRWRAAVRVTFRKKSVTSSHHSIYSKNRKTLKSGESSATGVTRIRIKTEEKIESSLLDSRESLDKSKFANPIVTKNPPKDGADVEKGKFEEENQKILNA